MNPSAESKRLAIRLKANEDSYVTGELDLNQSLDETERLWRQVKKKTEEGPITANEIMPDSHLMKIQTDLVKRSARFYKPDSLVFNAVEFAKKLKLFYNQSTASQSDTSVSDSQSSRGEEQLWLNVGIYARDVLYTVPSFNFINGTFDPDPVEVVKKRRKMKEKDKIGDLTRPQSMSLKENKDDKDRMVENAERVLGILAQWLKKNEVVCFYEFVTDPHSFSRTVENIFVVSLLVNQNCVRVLKDKKGLPCLTLVEESEKKGRNPSTKQCIMTIGYDEWKDIVKTFRFKHALIPPQKPSSY